MIAQYCVRMVLRSHQLIDINPPQNTKKNLGLLVQHDIISPVDMNSRGHLLYPPLAKVVIDTFFLCKQSF